MRGSSPLSNVDEIIDIFDTAYEQNNGLFERDYYYFINNPLTYYELQELYSKNEELYNDYIDIMFYGHPIALVTYMAETVDNYSLIRYVTTMVDLFATQLGYPHHFTMLNSGTPLVFKFKTTMRLNECPDPLLGVTHVIRCEQHSFIVAIDRLGNVYMRLIEGDTNGT